MHKNETIPFPLTTDLPKKFPINILDVKYASTYIPSITEKQNTKSPLLYILNFEKTYFLRKKQFTIIIFWCIMI